MWSPTALIVRLLVITQAIEILIAQVEKYDGPGADVRNKRAIDLNTLVRNILLTSASASNFKTSPTPRSRPFPPPPRQPRPTANIFPAKFPFASPLKFNLGPSFAQTTPILPNFFGSNNRNLQPSQSRNLRPTMLPITTLPPPPSITVAMATENSASENPVQTSSLLPPTPSETFPQPGQMVPFLGPKPNLQQADPSLLPAAQGPEQATPSTSPPPTPPQITEPPPPQPQPQEPQENASLIPPQTQAAEANPIMQTPPQPPPPLPPLASAQNSQVTGGSSFESFNPFGTAPDTSAITNNEAIENVSEVSNNPPEFPNMNENNSNARVPVPISTPPSPPVPESAFVDYSEYDYSGGNANTALSPNAPFLQPDIYTAPQLSFGNGLNFESSPSSPESNNYYRSLPFGHFIDDSFLLADYDNAYY